jgi:predicted nucleic acid-binding protein
VAAYFFDSSALVKRYVQETGTVWIVAVANPRAGHTIYLARITAVEVIAAMARRRRDGSLPEADAAAAASDFRYDLSNQYRLVDITPTLVDHAMRAAEAHPLCGYDAVQLAAALGVQSERRTLGLPSLIFVSADRGLNGAASAEGLTVDDANAH